MMWKLFQLSVGFAVMASDQIYHWSTGPMVAPFCALMAALFGTALMIAIKDSAAMLIFKKRTQKTDIQRIG